MAVEAGGGAALRQVAGMAFDPVAGGWALSRDVSVNWISYFQKQGGGGGKEEQGGEA